MTGINVKWSRVKEVKYPSDLSNKVTYVSIKKINANIQTKAKTKGASNTGNLSRKLIPLERQFKLKELGKLVRGS